MTEIVYLCSPDRGRQVAYSLTTLLRSGTTFDQVTVYVITDKKTNWETSDSRIIIKNVEPLFGKYFHGNKVHLCNSSSDTVIFLDADTFILNSLDDVLKEVEGDFLARVALLYNNWGWDSQAWQKAFDSIGRPIMPMFNAGFLVFRNGSAAKIKSFWSESIWRYLRKELPYPRPDERMLEQFGLPLALSAADIKCSQMKENHHWYAWAHGYNKDAYVFHTTGKLFKKYAEAVQFSEEDFVLKNTPPL
jgi:hypothetical protein